MSRSTESLFRTKEPDYGNYIPDRNPFNLPKPPAWWLKLCFDFDKDLKLVPSRTQRVYRLARPIHFSLGISDQAVVDPHADTAMLQLHGLVPCGVCLIPAADGSWTTNVFQDLANRDIWRHGGPEKFTNILEENERKAEKARDKRILDECFVRRRDMARSFKARTGQRTKLNRVKPKQRERVLGTEPSTPSAPKSIILASS